MGFSLDSFAETLSIKVRRRRTTTRRRKRRRRTTTRRLKNILTLASYLAPYTMLLGFSLCFKMINKETNNCCLVFGKKSGILF